MYLRRNVYNELLRWKNESADKYALLLEGPRRVGKTTIVKEFAKNEYETSIIIDFSKANKNILDCFEDINDLDMFFRRIQIETGINLIEHKSLIVFDEIQLFPKARQAIKHLVEDARYNYIETGSLISIKKNVKDILIPSEEMKINIYPMTFEEFCEAINSNNYKICRELFNSKKPIGNSTNRKLMRDFRIYMAVGGMPQAVLAYVEGKNFTQIDNIKREIINLYLDDFKKIDPSGKLSALFEAIPSFLARDVKKYRLTSVLSKRRSKHDDNLIYELIDSKTVLVSYNCSDPRVSLTQSKDIDSYKLYYADTGLFVTSMFLDRKEVENEIYSKLLSDKLPANLGYLYENVVAQQIAATNRSLYYHTWLKKGSTHYYEIDFLLSDNNKVIPIEVKSSGIGKFESLDNFTKSFSKQIHEAYVLSQKDYERKGSYVNLPIYLFDYLL